MSNEEREIHELKEKINALEAQVQTLRTETKRERPAPVRFFIGFAIVMVAILISIGVFQFVTVQ